MSDNLSVLKALSRVTGTTMAVSFLLSGCTDFDHIRDLCSQPVDTTNLEQVTISNWTRHGGRRMTDPHYTLEICEDHFAAGTPAGDAARAAVARINEVVSTELDIRTAPVPHLDKLALYANPPTGNYYDYIDNLLDRLYRNPCHDDNEIACGDLEDEDHGVETDGFTLNMCGYTGTRWNGISNYENVVISANAYCFAGYGGTVQPGRETDTDPEVHGVMHEVGHTLGMRHTDKWPARHRHYISLMQGNMLFPSAYDAAYLRRFYGHNRYIEIGMNYAASTRTRFPNGDGTFDAATFWGLNPMELHVNRIGTVVDGATNSPPAFRVGWFNNGTRDADPDRCFLNSLALESTDGTARLVIHDWRAATMPAESQDQWRGAVPIDTDAYEALPKDLDYELVFQVDHGDVTDEVSEDDNRISYPITLN